LLTQYVGLSLAKEMILTGDLYGALEMDRRGLLNVMTPPGDLGAATETMLSRVIGHSRTAVAAQKRLFELWQNVGLVEGIAGSIDEFAAVFAHDETAERVEAYRQQRAQRHRLD
jgi:enoyl-CoA hydratase/carnithine racemase